MIIKRVLLRHCVLSGLLCVPLIYSAAAQSPSDTAKSIKLEVLVTDKLNQPVTHLKPSDFVVVEDNESQIIASFEVRDVPVSYGLILDNTGSMRPRLTEVRQAAEAVAKYTAPEDRGFVARMKDHAIRLIATWTSEKSAILEGLRRADQGYGRSALIDAIHLCSEYLARNDANETHPNRRRILILISDGVDNSSEKKKDELFARLHNRTPLTFLERPSACLLESPVVQPRTAIGV